MLLNWESFPSLSQFGLRHRFSLRSAPAPSDLHAALIPSIQSLDWKEQAIVEAAQPHGREVAAVGVAQGGQTIAGVDALITNSPGVVLAIRAADCGPIYLYDPVQKALGVIHSGRKGTELNIAGATIDLLCSTYQSRPEDILAFLGPCIRPPFYEVDFAAEIGRQIEGAGVRSYIDSGLNTAAHLDRYYSYRAEKGKTGRMWAIAMLE